MSSRRMTELVSSYRVPADYVCRILGNNVYAFMPSPLEVVVCEESL